jgi:hypothetical protein
MINKPFSDDDFKLIVLDTWALARSASPIAALTMDGLRVARTGSTD